MPTQNKIQAEKVLAELKTFCFYDPKTGDFVCTKARGGRVPKKPGDILGSLHVTGLTIWVAKANYLAHRLAWLWMTGDFPKYEIDHIDGNNKNNSWQNLRDVPHFVNMQNQNKRSTNTSGYTGVYFSNQNKKWIAATACGGQVKYIGSFSSKEEAAKARQLYHENSPTIYPIMREGK